MIGFPVLAVHIILDIVAVLFVLSSIVLVLVVLIQKGKGGGHSGAFGGGMAGNLLGSKTGDFLTWVTIVMVGLFLTLAVIMAKWYKPTGGSKYLPQGSSQQEGPTAPTTPGGAAPMPGDTGELPGGTVPPPTDTGQTAPAPVDTNAPNG